MKICDYCGRSNEDEAVICRECGTQEFKTPPAAQTTSSTETPPESLAPGWKFEALTPQQMQTDLVTLIRCRTLTEADMVVSELRSTGIAAFIPDEFLSQAVLWNLNTYGYVRVQVSPKDYESAKGFLLASPLPPNPASRRAAAEPPDGSGVVSEPPLS